MRGPVWPFWYFMGTQDAQRRGAIPHLPLFVKVCVQVSPPHSASHILSITVTGEGMGARERYMGALCTTQ